MEMTHQYKIVIADAWCQKLVDADNHSSVTRARIINTPPHGWMAHRGDENAGDDPSPVNVSRWINQPDGPEKIAQLLGIEK
jgi:hypothetical protein